MDGMNTSNLTGESLLKFIGKRAREKPFHLHVWQWAGHPLPVGQNGGHSANSLHFQKFADGIGRAFDAYSAQTHKTSGNELSKKAGVSPHKWLVATVRMGLYARAVRRAHGPHMTELIHNSPIPGLSASIKNGVKRDPSFWGSTTWNAHRNHVHAAV